MFLNFFPFFSLDDRCVPFSLHTFVRLCTGAKISRHQNSSAPKGRRQKYLARLWSADITDVIEKDFIIVFLYCRFQIVLFRVFQAARYDVLVKLPQGVDE